MPKIVILGSCKHEPYDIITPKKLDPDLYERDHEKAYKKACEIFYPAIRESDLVIVYAPDGIGDHTGQDLAYAITQNKPHLTYPMDHEKAKHGRQMKTRIEVIRKAIMTYRKTGEWENASLLMRGKGLQSSTTLFPKTYGFYGLTEYILTGDPDKILDPDLRSLVKKELQIHMEKDTTLPYEYDEIESRPEDYDGFKEYGDQNA